MAELTFPNETDDYRTARDELLQAEIDLRARVEQVAAMRRGLRLGGVVKEDYAFEEIAGDGQVRAGEALGALRRTEDFVVRILANVRAEDGESVPKLQLDYRWAKLKRSTPC